MASRLFVFQPMPSQSIVQNALSYQLVFLSKVLFINLQKPHQMKEKEYLIEKLIYS